MTEIHVAAPNFWWRAPADQVRRLVLIARAVAEVPEGLAAGSWEPEEDPRPGWYGPVKSDADGLTATGQKFVQAWFGHAEAVRADRWFEPLTNGRHRLRASSESFVSGPIPISA